MKNATATAASPAYYRMCSTGRLLFKNKPAAVAPKETITHHFFVSELRRKLSMQLKFCGGAENEIKQQTQQTFVNGLLGFITLGIYTSAGSACVLLTIIA